MGVTLSLKINKYPFMGVTLMFGDQRIDFSGIDHHDGFGFGWPERRKNFVSHPKVRVIHVLAFLGLGHRKRNFAGRGLGDHISHTFFFAFSSSFGGSGAISHNRTAPS